MHLVPHAVSDGVPTLTVSENNGSSVFVEMLRGRDGLPGRDGQAGRTGDRGPAGPPGPRGPRSGGAIYTRWGKSSCPTVGGTELLYTGIAGGTFYNHKGGAANYLCMPLHPEYSSALRYIAGAQGHSYVYGAEYENPIQSTHDHNVPCAVCYVSTRPTVVMIPAKASCPTTWTREYYGYIMSERHNHHRSTFECVDEDQESLRDSVGNTNGALFYHVEANCDHGHLPCPPYNSDKELNCVVCTK
jgi:hypothetical protein